MDFKQRKQIVKPIFDYLKDNDCSIENLLGLIATLNAVIGALYGRLDRMIRDRDNLVAKIKHDSEDTWLD